MHTESRFLEPAAAAAVNHVLRGAAWARAELRRHAGKTARFELFPGGFSLTVLDSGEVAAAPPAAAPAVTLALSPAVMLRLAVRDERAWTQVAATGDTEFAATIGQLARNLRWDLEEDLSRVFGDVAAHRMAETGRALRRWGGETVENLARSFAEYWTEEEPLIARAYEIEEFNRAVDTLRDDLARLEKRIERLAREPD